MKDNKSWYKKWLLYLLGVIILAIIITIPFVINETYKDGLTSENPYITMWGAEDVLNFYGTFLAFVGTVSLGYVAYKQNEKANTINDRLLRIEEERQMPLIDFFDYEINLNIPRNPLPTMSFDLSENTSEYKEIHLLVRNISEIHIDKIEIDKIRIFQKSQNNVATEIKKEFNETIIECSKIKGYMSQISSLEYKELLFFLPTKIRTSQNILDITNSITNTNTRFEMVLKLTTYSQRTYSQKIEFINYYTRFAQENKITSTIINKHISIQEDK